MRDPNLVRVLQAQSTKKVGLIRYDTVMAGVDAIRARIAALRAAGVAMAVVDAVSDADLERIGAACADLPLVTAGSGVGLGLARHYQRDGLLQAANRAASMPAIAGAAAVVSGSCSVATNAQVAHWLNVRPGFRIDPLLLATGENIVATALSWAGPYLAAGEPVLVYATSEPAAVQAVQAQLGVERAGGLVEDALARIAQGLVRAGVRRLVVAGGETSGAVVQALGVSALRIGPQIDPGVPWTESLGSPRLALALKSGNFGTVDFFEKALAMGEAE
jgi:uncharacterized protein YgbK (DUF1537 family)